MLKLKFIIKKLGFIIFNWLYFLLLFIFSKDFYNYK